VVVERPQTEAELVVIVRRAAALRRPVRVGRVRRDPRWDGDQILVDLVDYRGLVRVDREAGQATVEAGISLARLAERLGAWGLAMENGGRDPEQSLGAAISLGAHGSSAALGALPTQVIAMRLIAPDGSVVECSAEEEPEIFGAARVGRGALGVISTVRLRCVPGFNLRHAARSLPLEEALDRFDAEADIHDHVELSWLPGRSRARLVTADRTDDPPDGGAVDRGYRWFNRRRIWPPKVSYSFPRRDSAAVLRRARDLSAGRRFRPLFPIEVSVAAGDDIPLSPAEGRPSLFVAGVAGLGGRPEWGTAHGMTAAALRPLYPRWDEWAAVRDRLDPSRQFAQTSGQG
jgi:L-gulonolactone oxidase